MAPPTSSRAFRWRLPAGRSLPGFYVIIARGGGESNRMLSRLQELRKEEETLLRVKAALHDQLNRLKVEELALQSMISAREGLGPPATAVKDHAMMDNEAAINQTKLQLQMHLDEDVEEEEEEEVESDS